MTALNRAASKSGKDYILFLSILLLFISGCNTSTGTKADESKKSVTAPVSSTIVRTGPPEAVIAADIPADSIQSIIKGKWLRSDGTYTIEIFTISDGGKMDAGYFNPNPINVGNSSWTISDGIILMQIVLKDVNYPGSTYNLMYNRGDDVIAGTYFQAVHGISYDVVFTRNK